MLTRINPYMCVVPTVFAYIHVVVIFVKVKFKVRFKQIRVQSVSPSTKRSKSCPIVMTDLIF